MLAGLLFIGATPAQAAPPTSANNFNPQDSAIGEDGIGRLVLTDKFDGVDNLAHFSSVATTDTTQAFYVVCPQGTTPVDETVPPAACATVGNDTTGTVPSNTAAGQTGVDEAYESFWDIPSTFDAITRDILVYHCNGAPTADEPGGNCALEIEPDVFIDDASTATSTTGAEFLDYCVDFTGDEDCADDGETREAFGHGATIPNITGTDELIVRARSSDDGITTLTACLDGAADAAPGSLDDCSINDSSGGQGAAAFKNYTFVYSAGDVPDSAELGFFLHNLSDDGSGACSGFDCLLDSHYVVSTARVAASAVLSFARQGSSSDDLDIPLTAGCDDPDTEDTNSADLDASHLVGCLSDQFNAPIDGQPTTFESAGVGGVFDGDCDTLHDHNDDLLAEHCHADDSNGEGEYDAEVFSEASGTQTITFCLDEENGGTNTTPPADHGCADETAVATATKTWTGVPGQVTLVFDDGVGDSCDGPTNLNNRVGNVDDLVACVFDSNGDPASTEPEGNGELQWFIEQGADDFTDTRFTTSPPQETDAVGHATANIEAVDPGTDNITVVLLDENGEELDRALVQKQVSAKPRSNVNIKHRTGPHRFKGRVSSKDPTCVPGRTVVVKRRRAGADKTIGSDTTNANGKYTVRHKKTNKKKTYYAKVRGNAACRADTSRNIRVR